MSKWVLRPGWKIVQECNKLCFENDLKQIIISSSDEINDKFSSLNSSGLDTCSLSKNEIILLTSLKERGIIYKQQDENNLKEIYKNSRFLEYCSHMGLDLNACKESVENCKLLVLGIGGIGCIIIEHLVRIGLRNFVLVDSDIVESSNLERQFLYKKSDIGKKKVDIARNYIIDHISTANILCIDTYIADSIHLEKIIKNNNIDLAAVCIDKPAGKSFKMCSSVLWANNIPFISSGVMMNSGFFGPFFDKKNGSIDPKYFPIETRNNNQVIEPTSICFPAYNSIIASHMAGQINHFIIDQNDYVNFQTRTFINFKELEFHQITGDHSVN